MGGDVIHENPGNAPAELTANFDQQPRPSAVALGLRKQWISSGAKGALKMFAESTDPLTAAGFGSL